MLQQVDIAKTPASTATFIIRVCTLWFAVLIGLLALVFVQVYLPRKAGEGVEPLSLRPEETPGRTV